MLNITRGKQSRPVKAVIYGPEGIGKSTLASKFPDPIFIDLEQGTSQLDVPRIDEIRTWGELIGTLKEIAITPGVHQTIIIDTADAAEQLAIDAICHTYKQSSIESFGYGKGYTYLAETWNQLLSLLNQIRQDTDRHVCIIAHSKMRKFELPDEAGAYDRWELKLTRQVAPLVKEWADLLLFLNYKTFVQTSETGTKKAVGGQRVMYASHNPCWDAKNRFGLPDEMELDFEPIKSAFKLFEPVEHASASDIETLRRLIAERGVTEQEVKTICVIKRPELNNVNLEDYDLKFLTDWIIPNLENIEKTIKNRRK